MAENTSLKADNADIQITAEIMKAMGHSDRLAIIKLLCTNHPEGLSVKVIYEKLKLQQPVVSRHLNILKHAGVVRRLQTGQKVVYCLCTDKKNIGKMVKCFC